MPYSKKHKQQSRTRILESAAKLFTSKGFDNTSIDEIMADSNMTRGAFYAHFANKSELYTQAIVYAASNSILLADKPDDMTDRAWFNKLVDDYLSITHVNQHNRSCPIAFMVTDVVNRDPVVRKTYTKIYKGMNKIIANQTKSFSSCDETTILAITAMMIGGVAIGRALDDANTQDKVLRSCKNVVLTLLNGK